MINKAIVDYVFKTKKYNLNSLNTNAIEADIEATIDTSTEKTLYSFNNLDMQEYLVARELEGIISLQDEFTTSLPKLDTTIKRRGAILQDLITECQAVVNTAILSEKKLVGESFTATIPLTAEYTTTNTTSILKDNIILGTLTSTSVTDGLSIDAINIVGEDFTEVKSVTDTFPLYLEMSANVVKTYNQIRVTIPAIVNDGVFSMIFDEPQVVSILNKDGLEIFSKQVLKNISVPINASSLNFKVRFHNNKKKSVKILSATYTDKIYADTNIVYETKPLAIGQKLSAISIETCDNYSDNNVDIQYYIAINNREYESFRPSGKTKLTSTVLPQSIIKTDRYIYNDVVKLTTTGLDGGVYKYYTDELIPNYAKLKMYSKKLGADIFAASRYTNASTLTLEVFSKTDLLLTLNNGQSISVDGVITIASGNTVVNIPKGMHTLVVDKSIWKESVDLDKFEIKEVHATYLVVVDRIGGGSENVSNIYDTAQSSTNSLYIQLLLSGCDIFLKKEDIFKKLDANYTSYFYRESNDPIYLLNYSPTKMIDNIQIKAVMTSRNKTTCPYISKIVIRGI